MEITEFRHAAILISNLEQSEQFYSQVLGLSKIERPLKFPGIWYQIGDVQIHLMVADSLPTNLVNQEKWGRNCHLAFSVANLDAAKQQLLQNGYQVQMSASGRSALFTQDPDGNIIELSE